MLKQRNREYSEVHGDNIPEIVGRLLESSFWLPTLEASTRYDRLHDDHDGTYTGKLCVAIGADADAYVETTDTEMGALRFRVPMIGGGMSGRVRTALVILAEAIRLDNEERPLVHPDIAKIEASFCDCKDECNGPDTTDKLCRAESGRSLK